MLKNFNACMPIFNGSSLNYRETLAPLDNHDEAADFIGSLVKLLGRITEILVKFLGRKIFVFGGG